MNAEGMPCLRTVADLWAGVELGRSISIFFFLGGGGADLCPPIARGGVAGGPARARALSGPWPSIFYRKAFPVRPYCSRPTGLKRSTSYLGFVFMLDLNMC